MPARKLYRGSEQNAGYSKIIPPVSTMGNLAVVRFWDDRMKN